MAKIRLTETQLKMLAEERNILDDYKMDVESTIKALNIIFSKLIFSNVAEIIDDELNLGIIEQEFERINDNFSNKERRMNDFFNNKTQEDYDANWEQQHHDLDTMGYPITKKQNFIYDMLNHLSKLEDLDYNDAFSDIEQKNI